MTHTLVPPVSEAEWQAFHDIREAVLWTARGRTGYDRRHVDDYDVPQNQPLLLMHDDHPVGTIRLDDLGDGTGAIRLVAVVADTQRRGHGKAMLGLCEERARGQGIRTLVVNSAPEAVGFYEKLGWERFIWNFEELAGIASDCVQMHKML